MARFEVHIPAADPTGMNVTLRVDAEHWMAALRTGLLKLGEQGSSVQNVLVDVQSDGSVHVTESRTGRVFQIREAAEQRRSPPDEHPTLLEFPSAPPPQKAPASATPKAAPPPLKPTSVPAPAAQTAAPRGDSNNWPWAASLSAHGQLEDATAKSMPSRPAPPPRTRTPIAELQASVVELPQPSRAVEKKIGRTLDGKKDRRQEIDDALADVFERVQELYSQPNEQASLYLLLDLALEKIPAESGSVLMSDAGSGALAFAAARGPKASELLKSATMIPSGVGIAGFCAVEGVSVALSDVQRDARWHPEISERLNYPTKSVLCAPMMTHGRAFGCMQLINRSGGDAFTEHEVGMLAYIAHQGALYLNSRG
ncbi:MAG TPA: GAF domain-containing protein [Myxococcaceae bacterium]|nr:GAF domain-containing protein [Myxococcaceae bacterium]